MVVEVNMEGVEALARRLDTIEQDLKKKGGRFALRKAANLVADAARQNARRINDPSTSENIAKNIAVRWSSKTFKRTGNLAFRIGVLGGAKTPRSGADAQSNNPGGATFYWRFVEFGSQHNSPARPFLRPALSENIDKAAAEFIRQYNKALDRALRRVR